MNILSQNYNILLKNTFFKAFNSNFLSSYNTLDSSFSFFNYIDTLSNLDNTLGGIAKQSLIHLFESLDKSFKHSLERKRKYEIKSYHSRTILTVFGEITFKRTFYKSKLDGKSFCFVDRYLGLHKYDCFDPYLKALVIDYASCNSYPKTAKYINDLIGNRISIDKKLNIFLDKLSEIYY